MSHVLPALESIDGAKCDEWLHRLPSITSIHGLIPNIPIRELNQPKSIEGRHESDQSLESMDSPPFYRKSQFITNKRKYGDWLCPHANHPQSLRIQVKLLNHRMEQQPDGTNDNSIEVTLPAMETPTPISYSPASSPQQPTKKLKETIIEPVNPLSPTLHSCPVCHLHFSKDDAFRRHVKHEHVEKPRAFECDQCEKKFVLLHHMNDHKIQFHSGQQGNGVRYVCQHCKVSFVNNSNRRRHLRSAHNVDTTHLSETF